MTSCTDYCELLEYHIWNIVRIIERKLVLFSNPEDIHAFSIICTKLFVTVYEMLMSWERSKIWKNCKRHYLSLLANVGDEGNLIFSFISSFISMTLFRTSVTTAGVKHFCCNSVKNKVFVPSFRCTVS